MSFAENGKWMIVRSDKSVVSIDKKDFVYVLGRSRKLPVPQQLTDKYASRHQLAVVWRPPHLLVANTGKNPVFCGPASETVPAVPAAPTDGASITLTAADPHIRFVASDAVAAPARGTEGFTVTVPPTDPARCAEPPAAGSLAANTLFFPEATALPALTVRFAYAAPAQEGSSAQHTSLTAAQMLAVPVSADGEDDEGPPTAAAAQAQRQGWQGVLDVVMQQQAKAQQKAEGEAGAAPAPAPAAVAAPSPPAKTTRPSPVPPPPTAPEPTRPKTPERAPAPVADPVPAPAPPTPAVAPPAPPAGEAKATVRPGSIGFWEWKCQANGKDSDPRSWRKYPLAVAQLLEEAYVAGRSSCRIPDSLMGKQGGGAGAHTYSVCFAEASLDGGMIQYQTDDASKFRPVRRTGGPPVNHRAIKRIRVIPGDSSSDDEDESFDSSESESDSESLSESDSEDSEPPKKKRTRKEK